MTTTLRAATSGGGARRRLDQTARLRRLLEATQRGGFLLPSGHPGCVCDWVSMDSGYAVCRQCGQEHWCCRGTCPEIDTGHSEHACAITGCITMEYELRPERSVSERVGPQQALPSGASSGVTQPQKKPPPSSSSSFSSSACVPNHHHQRKALHAAVGVEKKTQTHHVLVMMLMLPASSSSLAAAGNSKTNCSAATTTTSGVINNNKRKDRGDDNSSTPSTKRRRPGAGPPNFLADDSDLLAVTGGGNNNGQCLEHTAARCEAIRQMVESTVRELLASDKTRQCLEQERSRNDAKEVSVFARLLRELAHDRRALRPNMVTLVGQVAFLCRKNRAPMMLQDCPDANALVDHCTDAITGLLLMHGGPRVARQMQNSLRYRDFVASLLYLCRVGVSFQGRQVLPRIDVLHRLLPLQVLLPTVFHIRSKAITEGENLIKLDLKQLPL